jgi:hypothetical protein
MQDAAEEPLGCVEKDYCMERDPSCQMPAACYGDEADCQMECWNRRLAEHRSAVCSGRWAREWR